MNQNIISLVFMFCFSLVVSSQNSILYMGGIAHLGNGEKIENSVIVVKDGKFDIVADANRIRIDPSAFDTIIKIYGKHVYPAFISPNTTLGMTEIDAVRATKDFDEVGKFNVFSKTPLTKIFPVRSAYLNVYCLLPVGLKSSLTLLCVQVY